MRRACLAGVWLFKQGDAGQLKSFPVNLSVAVQSPSVSEGVCCYFRDKGHKKLNLKNRKKQNLKVNLKMYGKAL